MTTAATWDMSHNLTQLQGERAGNTRCGVHSHIRLAATFNSTIALGMPRKQAEVAVGGGSKSEFNQFSPDQLKSLKFGVLTVKPSPIWLKGEFYDGLSNFGAVNFEQPELGRSFARLQIMQKSTSLKKWRDMGLQPGESSRKVDMQAYCTPMPRTAERMQNVSELRQEVALRRHRRNGASAKETNDARARASPKESPPCAKEESPERVNNGENRGDMRSSGQQGIHEDSSTSSRDSGRGGGMDEETGAREDVTSTTLGVVPGYRRQLYHDGWHRCRDRGLCIPSSSAARGAGDRVLRACLTAMCAAGGSIVDGSPCSASTMSWVGHSCGAEDRDNLQLSDHRPGGYQTGICDSCQLVIRYARRHGPDGAELKSAECGQDWRECCASVSVNESERKQRGGPEKNADSSAIVETLTSPLNRQTASIAASVSTPFLVAP
ncbi:hypothetical protein B0H19DRAFT_1228236 [Mycena capillaripes]|nr:hypothetical protein B0H19DRAFT_1228236 [Mycena capillaripes]